VYLAEAHSFATCGKVYLFTATAGRKKLTIALLLLYGCAAVDP